MDQIDALSQYLNWVKRFDQFDGTIASPIFIPGNDDYWDRLVGR